MAGPNGYSLPQAHYGQPTFAAQLDEEEEHDRQRGGSSPDGAQISPKGFYNPYYTGQPRSPITAAAHVPIDRLEIIRRIKRGDSRPTSPELERSVSSLAGRRRSPTPPSRPRLLSRNRPPSPEKDDQQTLGMQIERPRSALHRGDFREREGSEAHHARFDLTAEEDAIPALATSPVAPWHPRFPNVTFRAPYEEDQDQHAFSTPPWLTTRPPRRPRTTSQASLASSFVYKAPTSPLVQSSRPDTLEPGQRRRSRSPDKSRRHTFSPRSFQHLQPALDYPGSARIGSYQQPPSLRAEKTFPYQAHQPRRSIAAFTSLPHSPATIRRPSLSDSPLHHAPMVGSYEESILRGRMSTTPSKPLNFVAQIGVLGKGNCKANLRCPPHATVPFPAVFYSYGEGMRNPFTSDQPSPYVGLVDIENSLPAVDLLLNKRRQRLQANGSKEGSRASSQTREDGSASDAHARRRRRQKAKRRSGSPKAPPGGAYRIPQQGQLQVIIKNPNKTAVKLFLIPYDLSDMEPGQKTFIRQRSYSAGPILDMPMTSRKNYGTDASLNASEDPNERPMLRYLIHLHICCPSKGRYFLYKSMRVVFANRVPDGKEKLRNEIQLPEPRYSTYKPGRDSLNPATANQIGTLPTRASPDEAATPPSMFTKRFQAQSLPARDYEPSSRTAQPLPFHLPTLESRPASRMTMNSMEIDSDMSHSTISLRSNLSSPHAEDRRLDNAISFDRELGSERSSNKPSESLLSMRLKDLGFRSQRPRVAGIELPSSSLINW